MFSFIWRTPPCPQWVSDAFVQAECAGIDQVAQIADGQVFGTGMLHLNLHSDKNLEQAAELLCEG